MTLLDALDWLSRGAPDGVPLRWLWAVCGGGNARRAELWRLIGGAGEVELTSWRTVRRAR